MARIHTISLGMVNVYLLEGESNVLVDTGVQGSEQRILAKLKTLGIKPESIDLIIVTHNHPDHSGSVEALSRITAAKVLAHKLEYQAEANGLDDEVKPVTAMAKIIFGLAEKLSSNNKTINQYQADILIEDSYDLSPYGIAGKVITTPGHTQGSLSVIINDQAIIGDSLMALLPFSRPSKPLLAFDLDQIKKNISMLIDLGVNRFYLSHGKDYDVSVVQKALESF